MSAAAAPVPVDPSKQSLQRAAERRRLLTLCVLLSALMAGLAVGLAWPLRLFAPPHHITAPEPIASALGISAGGALRFGLVLAAAVSCYVYAIHVTRVGVGTAGRRLILFGPVAIALVLGAMWPASSKDAYHYLMEGRVFAVHGGHPGIVPPKAYPDDSLYWMLSSWEDTPSRYGPVHNLLVAGVVAVAGEHAIAGVLLLKVEATASLFGSAALAYLTLRPLCPRRAPMAYALIAWNPQALYEAAANAHNDLLMVFSATLALFLAARGRVRWVFPALAIGVLTKYIVVLLGPVLLLWLLRSSPSAAGSVLGVRRREVVIGLALACGLCVGAYLPFWAGNQTLAAITAASGDMLSSPGWLLRQVVKHPVGWERAGRLVSAVLGLAFFGGYGMLLYRQWRQQPASTPADRMAQLALACLLILLLELCTISWWLWPWYSLWLLPPAALLAGRRPAQFVAVITCGALLAYLPLNFREYWWGPPTTDRMPLWTSAFLFLPGTVLLVWWRARGRLASHRTAD